MLIALPVLRLTVPSAPLPDPLPPQHQTAETLAFVLAFAVVLPLAGVGGYRLAARLTAAIGERALLSVAACLLAGLSLVVLAARGTEAAGLGRAMVWLPLLALAWWLAAAGSVGSLLTRDGHPGSCRHPTPPGHSPACSPRAPPSSSSTSARCR